MHEQTPPPTTIPERDLDEVLRSLEVELFAPPKHLREREPTQPDAARD